MIEIIELPRLYADHVQSSQSAALSVAPPAIEASYRIADLTDLGIPIEPERFYDASYKRLLTAMIAHVLTVEAPIYEDVVVRRIARAHGIQRVGHLVREAILDQIDQSVARTDDDGRPLLWPPGQEPMTSWSYRPADPGARGHIDTPMPELVGLAGTLQSGSSEAERVRLMAQRLGLSRIESSTRLRLERASELARQGATT